MKVLLDTNFCFLVLEKIRVLEQLAGNELLVTDFILEEVRKVKPEKASTVTRILKENNVSLISIGTTPSDNDDELLKIAGELGAAIATNDAGLKEKARKKSIQIFYLRQKRIVQKG